MLRPFFVKIDFLKIGLIKSDGFIYNILRVYVLDWS